MQRLLTPEEVAEFLGIKVETIYQWKFYGKIKFVKIGNRLRFREEDILAMVA